MTVTISGTSGITSPGVNSTGSNVLGDNVADTLNVGNGAIVTDSSGKVGIGTSSPSQKFVVSNAGADNIVMCENSSASIQMFMQATSGTGSVGTLTNHAVQFLQNNTERMRIDSSGNLLIGTTTAGGTTTFLRSTAGYICQMYSSGNQADFIQFVNSTNTMGSIARSGGTNVSYNTSSDYRLKENIQPMQNALDTVAQLNPVTYTWKIDGSDGQGFIAHELQAVVPDCVTGEKDAVDEEGKPVYQGIDTSFLVATLTKAIQELSAKNDALEARIAALEIK